MSKNHDHGNSADTPEGMPQSGGEGSNGGNMPPTKTTAAGEPAPEEGPQTGAAGAGGSNLAPSKNATAGEPAPDPFDPASLRLSQDFEKTGGVRKHIPSLSARKPTKEE